MIKFVSKFDIVLHDHIEKIKNSKRILTYYLSPQIINELIRLLSENMRNTILKKIKKSKYYGKLCDSTPDVSHREQLSQIIRYVEKDNETKTIEVKERFINFIEIHGKKSEDITNSILKSLEDNGLDIQNCRSQCYDNAAVMSGKISGVKTRIKKINPQIVFVNCDNHSLNLVGVNASKQEIISISFFDNIEFVYNFFAKSTLRWEILTSKLKITLKRSCETRWSSRHDAVNILSENFAAVLDVLDSGSQPFFTMTLFLTTFNYKIYHKPMNNFIFVLLNLIVNK